MIRDGQGRRLALIVASSDFTDETFQQLIAPSQDASSLAGVLADPEIGDFKVNCLVNRPYHEVKEGIETFLVDAKKEDLVLIYFSGHGVKDDDGRLYLIAANTRRKLIRSTSVPAVFINETMSASRSHCLILILDCCHSGAFAKGMAPKGGESVDIKENFQGRGRVVLTSSNSTQYAFQGDQIIGEGTRSIFTHHLVQGLKTGEADIDGDGWISLDELYRYVFDRVTDETPQQTPSRYFSLEGNISIAKNRWSTKAKEQETNLIFLRLQSRMQDWLRLNRRGGLLDKLELATVQEWLALPENREMSAVSHLQEYIEASSKAHRVNRRNRWLIPVITVLGVFLLAVIGWMSYAEILRRQAVGLNSVVLIPGGIVTIGDDNLTLRDTTPIFHVKLPDFYLETHEVSNEQYCLCFKATGCSIVPNYKDNDVCDAEARLPVTDIKLEGASQFCTWLGGRLPTEMEWEWAARGKTDRLYPTGSETPVPGEINVRDVKLPAKNAWPVDQQNKDFIPDYNPPNTLIGMAGNVREWTISWYGPYDQGGYMTTYWPDELPGANGFVAVRGGSFRLPPDAARSSSRINTEINQQLPDLGFRCLMGTSQESLQEFILANPNDSLDTE